MDAAVQETQMVRLTKRRLFSCLARVPLERSMLTLNSVTCQRHTTADGESRYYKVCLALGPRLRVFARL